MPTSPPVAAIAAELRVGQVAGVVGDAADAGVRGRRPDASAIARTSSIVAGEACATSTSMPRASIRRIISRPALGQAALGDAVRRAAERVVEEVARRHHPEAGVGDDLDVGRIVVERVRALDREQAGGDPGSLAPGGLVGRRGPPLDRMIARRPSERAAIESARGRQVQRARQESPPGGRRPAERQGEQHDVVAPVVVALDVQVARRLGRGGEHLERDVALDQPRDVDMAALRPPEQVAAPQQRVGVEVGHPQLGVERPRPVRGDVRRPRAVVHSRASVRPTILRPPSLAPMGRTGRGGAERADRGGPREAARHRRVRDRQCGVLTSSRKASERASRSSATRTKSRSAASVSRSMAGARRSVAMASMSRRW